MDISSTLPALALAVSLGSFAYATVRNRNVDYKADYQRILDRLEELAAGQGANGTRLSVVELKVNLFWSVIEKNAVTVLHHDHTPRRDELLEKYLEDKLSVEELQELIHQLQRIVNDKRVAAGERMAAGTLLAAAAGRYGVQ